MGTNRQPGRRQRSGGRSQPGNRTTAAGSRRQFLATVGTVAFGGCIERTGLVDRADRGYDRSDLERDHDHDATIGFVGDAMLGRNVDERYGRDGVDSAAVWRGLRPRLQSLDTVCCNLECCLSTRGERFPDRAYYFRAGPAWAVPALEAGNVGFASLANNHLLDYGPTALTDTLAALEAGGIEHAGAGETPAEAYAPASFSVGDLEVAVVSFADHFADYGVTDERAGTAYVDCDPDDDETRRRVGDALERARATEPDLLVASLHWGPNWVAYPDAEYVEFGHWLVDQGVDIVHGHSAHVIQGVERYRDGLLLHDTGDIVDDYVVKEDLRNDRSFLFEVGIDDGALSELRLVPVVIDDDAVRPADDDAVAWLHETMRERSEPFDTAAAFAADGDDLILSL